MSALSVICDDSRSVQKVRATTLASSRSCLSKMLGELLKSQPRRTISSDESLGV